MTFTDATKTMLSQTERSALHALLYFEIFSHPLLAREVFEYAHRPTGAASPEDFAETLDDLAARGLIFKIQDFYLTQDRPDWVSRRGEQNRRAEEFLPIARRMARFIGAFPFVRAVAVSGSLSKHSMSPDSDIDFFLVTQPGRLWLARTLLVVFKKIFLFNSHKYFCVNYFVDTEHLEIEEKNRFTALETVTLLPMYGGDWCEKFQRANGWATHDFYPNFPKRDTRDVSASHRPLLKKTAERLLSGWLGEKLDGLAMRATVGFWRRKFRHFDEETFGAALKSRRHVSKHHPLNFQRRVLDAFEGKLAAMRGRLEGGDL